MRETYTDDASKIKSKKCVVCNHEFIPKFDKASKDTYRVINPEDDFIQINISQQGVISLRLEVCPKCKVVTYIEG